nr:MAG TPA: zinc-ribbon domain protein [Siphoviridae sp. ctvS314]
MTETIRERSLQSRGRVRCDDCGRRIPEGERYVRSTVVDGGTIWECQPCQDAARHVVEWLGPYYNDAGYSAEDFYEWAREATGYTPADGYLFLYADVGGWTYYLEDLADSAAACASADADPARAWDDEAWAAFTWRMQTSPAFSPTN